jgi:hypothetical protein
VETGRAGTETDFRTLVLRNLGGAAILVALVAGMFWAIGSVGRGDELVVAADGPEESAATDPVAAPEEETEPPEDVEPEPEPEPEEEPEPEPEEEPEPEPEEEPEPEAEPEAIAPDDVTVQVLDGYQVDGGSAASGVAGELESAGYRIVAQNQALRYDVTAVLWTSGNEDAARQIADEIGAAEVRAQPGTLSESVAVHVVVGADRD